MTLTDKSSYETGDANEHGYETFTIGGFTFAPRRVLRPHRVAHGQPRAQRRHVPEGAAARRGVGLLLRHRQLRRRDRHGEPLRQRRPVRRSLQRRLPQGRARPRRELRHADAPRGVQGDARRLDERELRPVRQPSRDRQAVRREARQQHRGGHPPPRHRRTDGRGARRRADPLRRERLPDQPDVRRRRRRRSRRSRPSPASRARWPRSTCSPTCPRSNVTWNPSVVRVCKDSLYCPTTEEYILPIIHGNDRVEWFVQLSDEIIWNVEDRDTGSPRAKVVMKAGDVAAMPADIRHQGYSPKRSMLLVWENASPRAARADRLRAGAAVPGRLLSRRCPPPRSSLCAKPSQTTSTTATPSRSRGSPTSSRTPPATRSSARDAAT